MKIKEKILIDDFKKIISLANPTFSENGENIAFTKIECNMDENRYDSYLYLKKKKEDSYNIFSLIRILLKQRKKNFSGEISISWKKFLHPCQFFFPEGEILVHFGRVRKMFAKRLLSGYPIIQLLLCLKAYGSKRVSKEMRLWKELKLFIKESIFFFAAGIAYPGILRKSTFSADLFWFRTW